MAAIVREKYTWQPTVLYSGTAKQNAKINVWDADDAVIVNNVSTDVNGQITEQELTKAEYSITLTDTVATDDKTPHIIRSLLFTDSALETGKYASRILQISKNVQQASLDTFFLSLDNYVDNTKTVVNGYTGISFNHTTDKITITSNHTLSEIYEAVVDEAYDNPQLTPDEIMLTTDGINFDCVYDIDINNCTVSASGQWLKMPTKTLTLIGTGSFTGKVTDINGTQVTHVLTGLAQNTEVTYVDDADNPTVTYFHVENVDAGGETAYAYVHTSDFNVDILIFHLDYEPIVLEGVAMTVDGGSIPITQIDDPTYQNPI